MCRFIIGRCGVPLVRSTSDDSVNDLLLRVPVLGRATPGRQRGDHLIHGLAVRDRSTCNAGTNLNGRIFSFHLQNLHCSGGCVSRGTKKTSRANVRFVVLTFRRMLA